MPIQRLFPLLLVAIWALCLVHGSEVKGGTYHYSQRLLDEVPSLEKACTSALAGTVLVRENFLNVQYFYEVLTGNKTQPLQTGLAVERAVKEYLTEELILGPCAIRKKGQFAQDNLVRGVEIGGTGVLPATECTTLKAGPDLSCYVMVSSNTLFLDDSFNPIYEKRANGLLKGKVAEAFQNGKVNTTKADGIHGLYYLQNGAPLSNPTPVPDENVTKAPSPTVEESISQSDVRHVRRPISTLGILSIVVASAMFILAALYCWTVIRDATVEVVTEKEEEEIEFEFSRREQLNDYRVLVGANSKAEFDVTDDLNLSFSFPRDTENLATPKSYATSCKEQSNLFAKREGLSLEWHGVTMKVVSIFLCGEVMLALVSNQYLLG